MAQATTGQRDTTQKVSYGVSIEYVINFDDAGAELVDSVLDVVRKEAESCDCLQV